MGRQQMKKPWCGLLLMYKYNQLVVGVVSPAGGGCGLTCLSLSLANGNTPLFMSYTILDDPT